MGVQSFSWGVGFLGSGLAFGFFAFSLLGDGHIAGASLSAIGAALIGYACSGTRFRIDLEADGIRYRGLIRHTFVYWEDITAITWSGLTNCFGLKVADGQHVRISVGLTNLPEFARLILANVPSSHIDGLSRYLLTETVRGNPPSVKGGSGYVYVGNHDAD